MVRRFDELPHPRDLDAIVPAIKDVIAELHKNKEYTYERIADLVRQKSGRDVTSTAIRLFLTRAKPSRHNRGNATLEGLFDLLASDHDFPKAVRGKIDQYAKALQINPEIGKTLRDEDLLSSHLTQWLELANHEKLNHTLMSRPKTGFEDWVSGEYVMLRKCLPSGWYSRSLFTIERDPNGSIWATHQQDDPFPFLSTRTSRGPLMAVANNFYGILKIAKSTGLELLSFGTPTNDPFLQIIGFYTTIDLDGAPIIARVFLERNVGLWRKIEGRFTLEQLSEPNRAFIKSRDAVLNETIELREEAKPNQIPKRVFS